MSHLPATPPDPHVRASGHLEVGGGHSLYWEDWGNPKAKTPIIHLHGGPGAAFSDSHKQIYDPTRHRVIFHDQRGCGRSTPFASTDHNTTQDLVADIGRLREHLGLGRVIVAGGSWGSTLALLYALEQPGTVAQLFIWSVYLARQSETDWVNAGGPRHLFPAEWERFVGHVPAVHRSSGDAIMNYYAQKMRGADEREAGRYAFEWTLWEAALLSINYDPDALEAELRADPATTSIALLETHYFLNKCFIPENHILGLLSTIKHIPATVTHGRFDLCTPASSAYDLAGAYGPNLRLRYVNSGHRRSDPALLAALRSAAAHLAD